MSNIEQLLNFVEGIVCGIGLGIFTGWLIFSDDEPARTRRGRVRSKPLLGGADAPHGKGAGLEGKPAVGRREESAGSPGCPACGERHFHMSNGAWRCFRCGWTAEQSAPPNARSHFPSGSEVK